MNARIAMCHCGRLQLSCAGEPRRISMCHCLDCQRRTGSMFSVAVFYERAAVNVVAGETQAFARGSASGHAVTFHFCVHCGSNVYWEPARMPDLVGVAAGAFGDPAFPAPEQAVWMKDKHDWVRLPEEMAVFEAAPPALR